MSIFDDPDQYFMQQALREAQYALSEDEIPVGAIITCQGNILARAHNQTQRLHDVTAHAEMLAFTAATQLLDSKYLTNCTLYVTLEPCPMCAGASAWTQIGRIVYGASDPKRGFQRLGQSILHPKTTITSGVLAPQCEQLIKEFFKNKR